MTKNISPQPSKYSLDIPLYILFTPLPFAAVADFAFAGYLVAAAYPVVAAAPAAVLVAALLVPV